MIKRIPRGLNIFIRKNKKRYVSLPLPYIESSLSRGHQTVRDARGTSCQPSFDEPLPDLLPHALALITQ